MYFTKNRSSLVNKNTLFYIYEVSGKDIQMVILTILF